MSHPHTFSNKENMHSTIFSFWICASLHDFNFKNVWHLHNFLFWLFDDRFKGKRERGARFLF